MLSRRNFLSGMCSTAALAVASTLYPGLSFAAARTDRRLVMVILRGGMDGMAALIPYGDAHYRSLRGDLTIEDSALIKVDPFFALHPSLSPFADLYKANEMIAIPASATPYRARSHFDAQNVLELGSIKPHGLSDGWLNRLVGVIDAKDESLGLAVGQSVPQILRGDASVGSWAPSVLPDVGDDYISLIQKVYQHDKIFASSFEKALAVQDMTMDSMDGNEAKLTRKSRSPQAFLTMAQMAGKMLEQSSGPRIATLELGGWDTHANQGAEGGRMANNLSLFARGISAMKEEMKGSWNKTVVVAVSEFGRTARANGDRGTDHGTAGTMFLFGGGLKGGRVYHRWPGLASSELYENRDVRPTIDVRGVMKGVMMDHYGLSETILSSTIYPKSTQVIPLRKFI